MYIFIIKCLSERRERKRSISEKKQLAHASWRTKHASLIYPFTLFSTNTLLPLAKSQLPGLQTSVFCPPQTLLLFVEDTQVSSFLHSFLLKAVYNIEMKTSQISNLKVNLVHCTFDPELPDFIYLKTSNALSYKQLKSFFNKFKPKSNDIYIFF